MSDSSSGDNGRSIFVPAQDGLRLHVREYGSRAAAMRPVVCLPGMTRTVADFESLAPALADTGRRVVCIDSRGRGLSDYDSNPANYNVAVELADVMTVLDALAVEPAIFIGSSRGGILTMLIGVARPSALAGVVLHDIGPVIETAGVARIKSYVGKLPQPRTFADGAEILRGLFGDQFPKVTGDQWLGAAHRTWKLKDGAPLALTYDAALAHTLGDVDASHPLPEMWNEFDTLRGLPMLLIHGGNSDILTQATVSAMATRHPGMQLIEVPDEGHPPALAGDDLIGKMKNFIAACDVARDNAEEPRVPRRMGQ